MGATLAHLTLSIMQWLHRLIFITHSRDVEYIKLSSGSFWEQCLSSCCVAAQHTAAAELLEQGWVARQCVHVNIKS